MIARMLEFLTLFVFQDSKDNVPSTGHKRRARRAAVMSPGPRRQTRASTRAASGKVGKRGAFGTKKSALKVEEGADSDDGTNTSLRAPSRGVLDADADDISMVDDVFQERRHHGQGKCLCSLETSVSRFNAIYLTWGSHRYRHKSSCWSSVRTSYCHASPANQHASEYGIGHVQQERS